MANSTLVGFTSATNSNQCKEIQPLTTWSRDGNYKVTRRWVGPIDSLVNFSNGGSGNADSAGTFFSGATVSPFSPGGAGVDGAITVDLARDKEGLLGTLSVTWVTSDISSALGNPRAAGRTGASGDQFQDSSIWELDGNDIEKSAYDGMVFEECEKILKAHVAGSEAGFAARVRQAISRYENGLDNTGTTLAKPYEEEFKLSNYFPPGTGTSTVTGPAADPLKEIFSASSIQGNTNLLVDLDNACKDILRGQEAFTISQFVLRNTKTTTYASSLAPYYQYMNEIWKTSHITTLLGAETRPIDPPTNPAVSFTLPLIGLLGSGTGIFATAHPWLYRTPDVQQLNNGKWQITREWWEAGEISKSTYKQRT